MTITFLFPHPALGPTGGYKVAYEYANMLVADGHKVNIVYSGSIFWKQKSAYHKITNCIRYLQTKIKGYSANKWFKLDRRVNEYLSLSLNQRHVPKSDVYIATSPYTAWYLNEYKIDPAKKFYLIQDKEDWGPGLKAILADTYRAPMQKIVISRWLQAMLKDEYNQGSVLIPNGFDFGIYHTTIPPEKRKAATVSMLYHDMDRKDCKTGIKALELAKKRRPELRATLFGVPERPTTLPDWIEYHQKPDNDMHLAINNLSAIYLGCSKQEGWGLTVGEAMACSQAVVCTDNPGYREMAVDGRNALIVPVGDAQAMADALVRYIEDDTLRIETAHQAQKDIRDFAWDKSYAKLCQTLGIGSC